MLPTVKLPLTVLALFLFSPAVLAEDTSAHSELDSQLSELVKIPAPRVAITWEGLEEPPFRLVGAEIKLDGKSVDLPSLEKLDKTGPTFIHRGDVSHGQHELTTTITFVDQNSPVFSLSGGTEWKVQTRVTFMAQRGLETQVVLHASRNSSAHNPKEAFRVSSRVTPVMVAKLENGDLGPASGAKTGPDAGVKLAVANAEAAAETEPAAFRTKVRKDSEEAKIPDAPKQPKTFVGRGNSHSNAKSQERAAAAPSKPVAEDPSPVDLAPAPAPAFVESAPAPAPTEANTPIAQEIAPPPAAPIAAVQVTPLQPDAGRGWIPLTISGSALLLALVIVAVRRRKKMPPS